MREGLPLEAVELVGGEALVVKGGDAPFSALVDLSLVEGSDDRVHAYLMNIINHHSFEPRIAIPNHQHLPDGKRFRQGETGYILWRE